MTGLIPSATSQGSMAALPVTIDYPIALALRQMALVHRQEFKTLKRLKKHQKTDVYSTLPACHECTAVN
ncbi:integrase family protein [Escherichia coli]|nr:integrase family protein [Escherichia coli]